MRINETYGRFDKPAVDATRQGTGAAPVPAPKPDADEAGGGAAPGGERVTFSAQAQELASKAEAAKVNHLRAAIQNGTFRVDHQAIARRIVDGG
ncbi:MAG TPA: flagellar biosynthesis anti-sigma factor FlgM [Polyangiaceae bacterium]|nr:flagellar biosynthesis anti-sigma factor FlgM [Polyangiaceae bacterium]